MQPTIEMPSGKLFNLANPDAKTVDIYDIAWNLSRIPRFNGGTIGSQPYSVAEHSIWVAKYLEKRFDNYLLALYGLLHDAHEAYTGDITSPFKHCRPALSRIIGSIQAPIQKAIHERLDLLHPPEGWRKFIHDADQQALAVEAYQLLQSKGQGDHWQLPEIDEHAQELKLVQSYDTQPDYFPFLQHFNYLSSLIDISGKDRWLP